MFEVDFHILNQKATPAIYADTLANRPAFGFAGRIFINTASPYGVYRDTGSAWVQVASNGGGGGGSTGVNGLNGTTNIGLGGTITGLTQIFGAGFDFVNTQFNNYIIEASGSTYNSQISNYGDYLRFTSDNTRLYIIHDYIYTEVQGNSVGISLNDSIGKFVLGDYSNGRKYNSFVVNDDTSSFYLTTSFNQANTDQDLFYACNGSSSTRFVKIGDFNQYQNGVSLIINDASNIIYTDSIISGTAGIELNFSAEVYRFGANNALIELDNSSQTININSPNIILNNTPQINFATITNSATATIPANYLSIQINGNNYKILLLNP